MPHTNTYYELLVIIIINCFTHPLLQQQIPYNIPGNQQELELYSKKLDGGGGEQKEHLVQ